MSAQASPGERQILMVNVVNYNQNSTKLVLSVTSIVSVYHGFLQTTYRLRNLSKSIIWDESQLWTAAIMIPPNIQICI